MAPEPIHLDGLTLTPEPKSRRFDLTAGADKSTIEADKSRQVTWLPELTSLDKLTCQNGSTQLLVNTSRWVDLAARADTSRRVDFAAGANTSRLLDLAPRAKKSRWFDLAPGAEKSRWFG